MVHTALLQPQSWSSAASGRFYPLLWLKEEGLLTQMRFPFRSSWHHPEHPPRAELGSSDRQRSEGESKSLSLGLRSPCCDPQSWEQETLPSPDRTQLLSPIIKDRQEGPSPGEFADYTAGSQRSDPGGDPQRPLLSTGTTVGSWWKSC